jgi:pyrroline-5-carboxylate reductase
VSTLFIGGGNMAGALIGGLLGRGAAVTDLRVVEPVAEQRERLAARFPGLRILPSAERALGGIEVVVLAVKPQQMRDAVRPLVPQLVASAPVVLSIAAGVRLGDLSRWLGGYDRLVRAMPNTPALIGRGIAGVFAPANVAADERARAAAVLEAGGDVVWVERESLLDAVTAVSGSGPAYVFYLLEALEAAALGLAFAPADARRLAYATVSGAMALAEANDADAATLRAQVTSKGGTTERAVATLDAHGVKDAFVQAIRDAEARARELGDALARD